MPRSGTSTSATARAARRNVPSPPSTTRASVVGSSRDQRRRGRPTASCQCVDAADLAPAGRARAELDGGLDRRVVGEADARRPSCARSTSAIRSSISAQPGPGREVDEELAVALRPEDRRGDDRRATPRPERRGRRDDPLEDLAVDRRVAHDAVVGPAPAGLELRLDQRDDLAAGRRERRRDRAEDQRERDERDVDRRRASIGSGRRGRRSASGRWSAPSRPPAGRARSASASWPRPTSRA